LGRAPERPLWDATFASLVIAAVNIFTIGVIVRERSSLGMRADYLELYEAFPTLNPGQFRKVMRFAVWEKVPAARQLTAQGERLENLYYVRGGQFEVVRNDKAAVVPGDKFIGEVAFLQDGIASASVSIPAETSIVRWSRRDLKVLMKKSPNISNALIALFRQLVPEGARDAAVGVQRPKDLTGQRRDRAPS